LKKVITLLIVLCLVLLTAVSGCGQSEAPGPNGVVNVFNWGIYADVNVFKEFRKETGITVIYKEYQNNEEMYSSLKLGGANYDVVIPSDYMISRMIEEGMLEELDFSNIPNYSLINDLYKNLEYDPEGKYSVAYMTGTVGIIYNREMIRDEITSWSSLFDSRYAGQILMFNNLRDAFGIALSILGIPRIR